MNKPIVEPSLSMRIKTLNKHSKKNTGPVVYWMSRDQRAFDNYALLAAWQKAQETGSPLLVVFCLQKTFLGAQKRVFDFMIQGLMQVELDLIDLNIPFVILQGNPVEEMSSFVNKVCASVLYTDFSPLKVGVRWRNEVVAKISIPFYEVDAHNIVPVWKASNKREFSARTIRPKIHSLLSEFLIEIPRLGKYKHTFQKDNVFAPINWQEIYPQKFDKIIFVGGRLEAEKRLRIFVKNKLTKYTVFKNDPNEDVLSDLSPYLHFGQISAQRIALEVGKSNISKNNMDVFLEEIIVRRELAENFCYHTPNYDTFDAFPTWAKETLNKHRRDKRDFLYTKEDFENAKTHDKLWNATQKEMVKTGKMHGYMRMYWAKKILEWTTTPENALEIAIYLNDKYELDGRDPNGYAGIAWSMGGLHDRPWFERPIFGLVRYMNSSGAEKKFNTKKYIAKWLTNSEDMT